MALTPSSVRRRKKIPGEEVASSAQRPGEQWVLISEVGVSLAALLGSRQGGRKRRGRGWSCGIVKAVAVVPRAEKVLETLVSDRTSWLMSEGENSA